MSYQPWIFYACLQIFLLYVYIIPFSQLIPHWAKCSSLIGFAGDVSWSDNSRVNTARTSSFCLSLRYLLAEKCHLMARLRWGVRPAFNYRPHASHTHPVVFWGFSLYIFMWNLLVLWACVTFLLNMLVMFLRTSCNQLGNMDFFFFFKVSFSFSFTGKNYTCHWMTDNLSLNMGWLRLATNGGGTGKFSPLLLHSSCIIYFLLVCWSHEIYMTTLHSRCVFLSCSFKILQSSAFCRRQRICWAQKELATINQRQALLLLSFCYPSIPLV